MSRRILALGSLLLGLTARGAAPGALVNVPARDWYLPLFTDAGFLSMTLRGDEVRPVTPDRIDIVDMNITVFSGDAARQVETSIVGPAATFYLRERRATGTAGVRLLDYRDNLEIRGRDWEYLEAAKKVSLHGGVLIIYHAPLTLFAR